MLRGFSAPVRLEIDLSESDLLRLLAHDGDMFNRWQAAQTYATRLMIRSVEALRAGRAAITDDRLADALAKIIAAHATDNAFAAQAIALPAETDIARDIDADVDPDAIHTARNAIRRAIGLRLATPILDAYEALGKTKAAYSPDAESAGRRALRIALLDLYAAGAPQAGAELATRQFEQADNMTDQFGALAILAQIPGEARETAFTAFYKAFENDHLVMDKWFALQGMIAEPGALARVRTLMQHKLFSMANPNRLRSLIGAFCANPTQFHAADGSGYNFLVEIVNQLDERNPQVAARLLAAFRTWRNMEAGRRTQAETALRRVAGRTQLSADVRDIVDRSLA